MQTALLLPTDLVKGIFIKEIKNRFLCEINIDGESVVCYIPSSCRLSNFLNLNGREVLLKPVRDPKARTSYAVFAVKYKKNYIILNTSMANRIVETELSRRLFAYLGARKKILREKKIYGYKADFLIEDTKTVIEVKSIISLSSNAVFPTVYSQRAIDQLKKFSNLMENGYKVAYIFVSMNPYVNSVSISKEEPYYSLFMNCIKKGMSVASFSAEMKEDSIHIKKRLLTNLLNE